MEGCRSEAAFLYLSLSLSVFLFLFIAGSFQLRRTADTRQTLRGEAGPSKCVPINLSRRTSGVCVRRTHSKRAKSLELDFNGALPPRDAPDRFQVDQR